MLKELSFISIKLTHIQEKTGVGNQFTKMQVSVKQWNKMLYFWESNHIRICIRKMTFLNIIKIYPTVTNDFLSATTNPEWYNMLNDPKRRNLKKYFVSISNFKTPFLSKLILKWSLEDLTIFYFAGMQPMIWSQSMNFSLFQWTITQKFIKIVTLQSNAFIWFMIWWYIK